MEKFYPELFVNRRSYIKEAFMKSLNILKFIEPGNYRFQEDDIIKIDRQKITNKYRANIYQGLNYIDVEINWNTKRKIDDDDINNANNILNDTYISNNKLKNIKIPISNTNTNNLFYYDCIFLNQNNIFNIEYKESLPYVKMVIGKNYGREYILNKSYGIGCYLEYHNSPHLHVSCNENNSGYLVIGKILENKLTRLSAFNIPYNSAIYMEPNVIHNDCFLIGEYNVIYTTTNEFKTIVLHDKHNNIVDIDFE